MDEVKAKRREELYAMLGELPGRGRAVGGKLVGEEELGWGIVERWLLDLNGVEGVPAIFFRPRGEGRFPAVVYCHAHGGRYHMGKEEVLAGTPYMAGPWGEELVREGYAVLAIDHWAFGERSHHSESDTFKLMLWEGRVMWGMMVYDTLKAIDWLGTRSDVDMSRIATVGMSMGSTMAFWAAALDERVKVCVDICCLTDFQALIEAEHLKGHGIYYFVPGLLKKFTCGEINGLISPRAHLGLAGELDALTPVAGLDRINAEVAEVYEEAGVGERWKLSVYPVAHQETAEMRVEGMGWLKRWL
ncbi:MAG TPA: alpha/beta fold hydrolase [Tepidisphaeraceae bacterium]|jgi:pimeloyl-ACP methyl ester carboxylesterase|nr:alpha/beta fold hydrolase [Tepidisphaeraceae bacterium]